MNVIAIFDVGKTNKKVFLFSEHYDIVWQQSVCLPETVDDDGDPCEDITALTAWLTNTLRHISQLPDFSVRAVNFSAYGASLVHIGADGMPVGYLYNYLKPFPAWLRQQFYGQYGPEYTLSLQTASPALDSLNSGLMLYRIKHDKPDLFRRIWHSLHLPQYLSYWLTRHYVSDLTSIGCHTMLWDFTGNRYHNWVVQEDLVRLFGHIHPADQPLNGILTEMLLPDAFTSGDTSPDVNASGRLMPVGIGLHDSSAALIPYLVSFDEPGESTRGDASPFVLISTGTWCISLNPFTTQPLTAEELQYDCLCFMQYRGNTVKASRLFAGNDHEQQTQRLAAHFAVPTDTYKTVPYNPALIHELTGAETTPGTPAPAMQPAQLLHSSRFGDRDLSAFATYDLAYHQLMLDIMAQQVVSTALVLRGNESAATPVSRVFVDGGFSHNPVYMRLLAKAFPTLEVWAASVAQATALGAALAIHTYWNPLPIPPDLIGMTRYTN